MSRFLSGRPPPEPPERTPSLVALGATGAGAVFEALASRTARRILAHLYEEPQTASALADHVDTSLQNVTYHLGRLGEADLVDVVDTWYSSRGVEMKVYAPTGDPLLLVAGAEHLDAVTEHTDSDGRPSDAAP